jgi:hypothetical protein
MAYDFLSSSSQYLTTGSTPVTAAPLTFAVRFNARNITDNMILFQLSDGSATNRFFSAALGAVAGDPVRIGADQSPVSNPSVDSAAGFNATTDHSVVVVFASSTSRTLYFDLASGVTNTTSATPSGISIIEFGARFTLGVYGLFMNGLLSEGAIWNAALTEDEARAYAKGFKPSRIRPQSLQFYSPLIRTLQDLRAGRSITNNNSATVANHPRVY